MDYKEKAHEPYNLRLRRVDVTLTTSTQLHSPANIDFIVLF